MWRKLFLVFMVVFSTGLSGCKNDHELIEPYTMTEEIRETMSGMKEQGVYSINYPKEKAIIYQGIDKGIRTMSYTVENDVLTIYFETEKLKLPRTYVYRIDFSDSSYDTIDVVVDGKSEAFISYFLQWNQ